MPPTLRPFLWSLVVLSVALGPAEAGAQPFAYITNFSGASVSVIDASTGTVTVTVPVGGFPQGVAVHPSGAFVYVANSGDGSVSVIDASTNTVTATVPVGGGPFGIAVDPSGTIAYVTNQVDGTVSVIDVATNTVIATVPVGGGPSGVAMHPVSPFAYVASFSDGTVSIIDTTSHIVSETLTVGEGPVGVAVNGAGTRVYVALQNAAKVAVIDTATKAVVGVVVGSSPTGVAVSPSGAFVYVANQGSSSVSVLDVFKGSVSATVAVGGGPIGLSVHPSGTHVYVANFADDNVSVIDTATDTVTDTVSVGTGPYAFGQFIGPPLAASERQLTALGPAALWVGVTNSDNNGRRVDVRVEIYKNGELIGQGEALNRQVAGNALANATAVSIPLRLIAGPVSFAPADVLVSRVLARRAGNFGNVSVRLWYGNSVPPPASKRGWSHIGATVDGAERFLYYRGAACPAAPCIRPLETVPGVTGVASVLKATAGYQSFGDWSAPLAP